MDDRAITPEAPSRAGRISSTSYSASVNFVLYVVYFAFFAVILRLISPILLRYDDGVMMPVSYAWLNGLGFANPWYTLTSTSTFSWHGFLQPVLVAALAPCSTLACVNIGLVAIGVVYLLLWYAAVNTVAEDQRLRWVLYVIGVASVLQFSARPELVASLALVGITMVYLRMADGRRFALRALLAGGLAGLATTSSPVAGLFACLGVAAATVYLRRNDTSVGGFVLEGATAAAAALLATGLLIFLVFPYDAITWINGIREAGGYTAARDDASGFFKYHFGTKLYPLQVVMLIPLAAIAVGALRSTWIGGNRLLFAVLLVVSAFFAFILYFSAFRLPVTFYNFSGLIPALALIAAHLSTAAEYRQRVARLVFAVPIVLFAAVCGIAQLGLAVQKIHAAPTHDRMMARIASAVDRYMAEGRQIGIDPPLAIAVDDPEKLKNIKLLYFGYNSGKWPTEPRVDVLLRAQTEFGTLPADIPGYRLVENNFLDDPLARFVKPMALNFAIYEAEPDKQ